MFLCIWLIKTCVLRRILYQEMRKYLARLRHFLITVLFYPLFIVPYLSYVFITKLSFYLQYFFTLLYIQKICGFKRKQKVIQAVNSFTKLPQHIILSVQLNKFQLQTQLKNAQAVIQKIFIQDYIKILTQINNLETITVYVQSQSQYLGAFLDKLRSKIAEIKTNKVLKVLDERVILKENRQKLVLPKDNTAPLMIVFSKYQSTCHIPSKYLINAELAFNQPLMVSTKYDLYRSFLQYSHSKQRNGK